MEGYDAGRKIAIMASIAFSSRVTFPQVYTEGITKITAEDIRYAKEFGYVIKLLGITKLTGKGIEVKVHPTLIPDSHPLATVRDSFNAVFVHGQACDDAMFMGRGAGQMPTASAVLGDVIDVMRNIIHGSCGKIGSDSHKKLLVLDVEETKSRFLPAPAGRRTVPGAWPISPEFLVTTMSASPRWYRNAATTVLPRSWSSPIL